MNRTKMPGLSSDRLVARTVVDISKLIVPVRVLNLSDDEQIVREGTDVASCEVVDSVIVVETAEAGTLVAGDELPDVIKKSS